MKITRTLTVNDITWFYLLGTLEEVEEARQWCDANKTMWVIHSEVEPTNGGSPIGIKNKVSFAKGEKSAEVEAKFGFKSKDDAMRFKLSLV